MPWDHQAVRAHEQLDRGERAAEHLADVVGSWRFIGWLTVMIVLWVTCNLIGWSLRWDAYPFILLNLAFSMQAAYTGPILQLASNRAEKKIAELISDIHRMSDCLHRSPATGACTCERNQ